MALLRTKFHENLPSGPKVVSRGPTDRHIHTDWRFHKPILIFGKQGKNQKIKILKIKLNPETHTLTYTIRNDEFMP
jgi:hypothetical protein